METAKWGVQYEPTKFLDIVTGEQLGLDWSWDEAAAAFKTSHRHSGPTCIHVYMHIQTDRQAGRQTDRHIRVAILE